MYVRKVKKGGKVYSYYYKSQRIGNKVKSIYVGRAEERVKRPEIRKEPIKETRGLRKENLNVVNNLIEFDSLLSNINKMIQNKDLSNAIFTYNKLFEVYNKVDIDQRDRARMFEKLNDVYNSLIELSKENKISLD